MKASDILLIAVALSCCAGTITNASEYFPPRGEWLSKSARQLGFEAQKLGQAVQFAKDNEYQGERDLRVAILKGFHKEPFHEILGPTKKRGGPAGMVIKNGYIAAQWGDLTRVDMTFSVTKSYLSTVAGLAVDKGLIRDVEDKVASSVWDGTFAGEHNAAVTWASLLDQSSDWSGELFGIKDWADRPPAEGGLDKWKYRQLHEPGSVMEYNDVRVNVLAYSLLQVWRKPLPKVLKSYVMDPIGASPTWRWHGYDDAWVTLDGYRMQSVTGGGHSGGGIFVSTLDQARFGLLILNNGRWQQQQLLSDKWIARATEPSSANPRYGFMWWLNRTERQWPGVEYDDIFYAAGFGGNFIVIDQANDLLIVTRWLQPDKIGELVRRIYDSIQ